MTCGHVRAALKTVGLVDGLVAIALLITSRLSCPLKNTHEFAENATSLHPCSTDSKRTEKCADRSQSSVTRTPLVELEKESNTPCDADVCWKPNAGMRANYGHVGRTYWWNPRSPLGHSHRTVPMIRPKSVLFQMASQLAWFIKLITSQSQNCPKKVLLLKRKSNRTKFRLLQRFYGKKTSMHALRNCSAGGNARKSKSPDDQLGSHEGKRRRHEHPNGKRRCCHPNKNQIRENFLRFVKMVHYTGQTVDRNVFYCSWKRSLNALRLSSESTNIQEVQGEDWETRIKQHFPAFDLRTPRTRF